MMARLVREEPLNPSEVKRIAGVDVAYVNGSAVATAVLLSAWSLALIGDSTIRLEVGIPYIPGLLGFREAPLMARAIRGLREEPDVILVDGHGLAHPRRFGSACHLGVILDKPTIGVAKARLYGSESGEHVLDGSGNPIARIIHDRRGKPYYVSVGHRVTLKDAAEIVRLCMGVHGPQPLRMAHLKAREACRI
ncbi:endonuclease V [Candidatus Bathyarchaeota archaeon]|nr:endonuclease V [Candidatus Bathyarchaeota archaeon]